MSDIRTNDEIDELIYKCTDIENEGASKYPGMIYEQGIRDALLWMQGEDGLEEEFE